MLINIVVIQLIITPFQSTDPGVSSDRRGSSNTESDSGVQSEDLAYNITHRKGSV